MCYFKWVTREDLEEEGSSLSKALWRGQGKPPHMYRREDCSLEMIAKVKARGRSVFWLFKEQQKGRRAWSKGRVEGREGLQGGCCSALGRPSLMITTGWLRTTEIYQKPQIKV